MQRIMTEPARDLDGSVLGTSLSNRIARIDLRIDGTFYLEAPSLLERDALVALRALIDKALECHSSTVVLQY